MYVPLGASFSYTVTNFYQVLVERFANSTSLDDLFDSLETIYRDADKDAELKGWFKNMDHFIRYGQSSPPAPRAKLTPTR